MSITAQDRNEAAGILLYAREHYAQEAAAIYLLPRDGLKPNTIEQKMIDERLANARRCEALAKAMRGEDQ